MAGAVALVPLDQMGRGYGSTDLHKAHLDMVAERLERMHPDLKRRAIAASKAFSRAKLDLEAIQLDVRRAVGDASADAFAMIQREADRELTQELEVERDKIARGIVAKAPAAAEAFEQFKQEQPPAAPARQSARR